jgi:o-succinylbenzoate synthase
MDIDRLTMRFVKAELARPFENRWQRYHTWTKLVIQVDAGGTCGYAECSAMETPFYHYETIETAWYLTEQYLAPMLLRSGASDPAAAQAAWRDVHGHEEAKAGIECALWDLQARVAGRPLCEALGGAVRPVPVGATAGIEPTMDDLLANIERYAEAGFQRVRVKIRPGWDAVPLREIRAAFPSLPLIADANCAYGGEHVGHLTCLDEFGLLALEQPFPRDLADTTAELQSRITTPICLDEQIHSLHEAQHMLRLKAGRIVNIKIGRVGGLAEARKIHDFCAAEGVPTFVGAKWDQGIGRWCGIAFASLPNMTLPSDCGPAGGYYHDDGATPQVSFSEPGWVMPLAKPGIGAEPSGGTEVVRERVLTAKEFR